MEALPGVAGSVARSALAEPPPTFGVEEEFLLLTPAGTAACVAPEVIAAVPPQVRPQREFMRYQIESSTDICTDLGSAAAQLAASRSALAAAAAERGAALVALGTPPFAVPGPVALSSDPRYRRLLDLVPGVTGEEATCACHVHVAVPARELGVAVLNRIREWLPVLLALSGNSPLWRGRDSGWASHRFVVQTRWPTFHLPPRCADVTDYDTAVAAAVGSGAALDPASVYFLARLSSRYPTVEIRVPDVCLTVDDAVLLAALCRGLVMTAAADRLLLRPRRPVPDRLLEGSLSAAARCGLSALVVDPRRRALAPATEAVTSLVEAITPALDAAGDRQVVAGLLADRLGRGSGAERQLALWRSGGRRAFVRAVADLTVGVEPN